MSLRPPLHVSTFHSRTVVSMFGRLCHLFVHALSSLQVANAQCMTLRSLAPCLRAAREKHRFAAGKKHRNGKKHVWQQEKNALQREKAVSAAGKNASKKCRFAAGKIQSSRKNTLQQHKSTFAAEKMHFGGSGKKPSEAGKNPSEARKKPAEAGKKPAAEKVQLCNPKSCRNRKNTFPQREKAAALVQGPKRSDTRGRLLIGHKRELVKDLYIQSKKPSSSTNKTDKSKQPTKTRKNQNNTKTKQKTNTHRNDWLPVHWRIHARGDKCCVLVH